MKTLLTFILAVFSVMAGAQTISYRNLNPNQFSSNNFMASLKSGVRLTNPVVIGTITGNVSGASGTISNYTGFGTNTTFRDLEGEWDNGGIHIFGLPDALNSSVAVFPLGINASGQLGYAPGISIAGDTFTGTFVGSFIGNGGSLTNIAGGGSGDSFWFTNSAAANSISNAHNVAIGGTLITTNASLYGETSFIGLSANVPGSETFYASANGSLPSALLVQGGQIWCDGTNFLIKIRNGAGVIVTNKLIMSEWP